MNIIHTLKRMPFLKKVALFLLQPPMRPRPRWWVKTFVNPLVHRKGRNAFISRETRMDVFPYNAFKLGKWSTIEDWSCVNNALGAVLIGEYSRVGLRNTLIGPVKIGSNVNMAQNIVASGLNHGYEEISIAPRLQKCTTAAIEIQDDCWIGANVVITAGVTIGKHSVVAAGSVVTKDVPPFSIVAGNPAKVIKYYDFDLNRWMKVSPENTRNYGKAI